MKVFLALCLVASVIAVNGFSCGSLNCNDDQCCLRPVGKNYECANLAKEGEPCCLGGGMWQSKCPCVKGLLCKDEMPFRAMCVGPNETTTVVPTVVPTEVPVVETTTIKSEE